MFDNPDPSAPSEVVISPTVLPEKSALSPTERKELRNLEVDIAAGIRAFRDVGGALLKIRDARLYRETHTSFEAYCREKWDFERARAYQLMDGAGTVAAMPTEQQHLIKNEAQARALAPILRAGGVERATQVLTTISDRGAPLTAPLIRRISDELMHPNRPAEPTFADRIVRDMSRLTSEYRQWLATSPSRKEKTTVKAAVEQLIQSLA